VSIHLRKVNLRDGSRRPGGRATLRHVFPSNDQGSMFSPQSFRGIDVAASTMDLMQGTLDLLVLKALTWGPRHGYAVARWVGETTDDDLQIEEGALYTALHRMEARGWIEAEWGLSENNRKAKFYQIRPAGRRELRAASAR